MALSKYGVAQAAASKLTRTHVDDIADQYLAWLDAKPQLTAAMDALLGASDLSKSPMRVMSLADTLYDEVDDFPEPVTTLPAHLEESALGATYAQKTVQDAVETGRLSEPLLSATIATRAPSRAEVADHQFRGIPEVTSSPPTVTVTNNTAPATTMTAVRSLPGQSYTSIVCDDLTKYRPLGVGSGATRRGASGVQAFACDWLMGTYNPQSPRLEFLFDGPEIEFGVRQFTGAQYRLMVDGEYVTRYPQSLAGTAGGWGNIKVTFGSRAPRRIVLEMYNAGGPWFLGAWMGVNDTMRATAAPTRRLAVMGDSYAGGAYSSPIGTFVTSMSQTLGFRDFINAGAGSTGWLATGGKAKAGDRLAADVLNHAPTDVVLALGHNDTSFTNTSIAAEVTATLTTIRATLPDLRSLVVVGPLFAGSTPGVYTAMNDAMQAASAQADAFIDTVDSPIFTGTGRVGATTGDGNGDLYIGADGAHPTDAGNEWLGHALGQAILDATA